MGPFPALVALCAASAPADSVSTLRKRGAARKQTRISACGATPVNQASRRSQKACAAPANRAASGPESQNGRLCFKAIITDSGLVNSGKGPCFGNSSACFRERVLRRSLSRNSWVLSVNFATKSNAAFQRNASQRLPISGGSFIASCVPSPTSGSWVGVGFSLILTLRSRYASPCYAISEGSSQAQKRCAKCSTAESMSTRRLFRQRACRLMPAIREHSSAVS